MIRLVSRWLWVLVVGRPLPAWLPEPPASPDVLPGQYWRIRGIPETVRITAAVTNVFADQVTYETRTAVYKVWTSEFLAMATLVEPPLPTVPADAEPGLLTLVPPPHEVPRD